MLSSKAAPAPSKIYTAAHNKPFEGATRAPQHTAVLTSILQDTQLQSVPLDLPSCVCVLAVSTPGQSLHTSMARNSSSEQHGALALPGWKLLTCKVAWHKGPEVAQRTRGGTDVAQGRENVSKVQPAGTHSHVFSLLWDQPWLKEQSSDSDL